MPSVPIDAGSDCDIYVADPLIDHSCFHATVGPYRDRTLDETAGVIEVNRPHTAYRLELPRSGAEFGATLRYDVARAGGYAIFTSPRVRLTLSRAEGPAGIPFFASHDTEICPELPWVEAAQLAAGEHRLLVQSPVPHVTLVIEFMDEGALEDNYRLDCAPPSRPGGGNSGLDDAAVVQDAGIDAAPPAEGGPEITGDGGADGGGGCFIDPVLEHACLHVNHGPYAQVAAAASSAGPDVDLPHTAFTVAFPSGTSSGNVTYRPVESGQYVFYVGQQVDLMVRDAAGERAASFQEPVEGCVGLGRASVYDLVGALRYELSLMSRANAESTVLIVENVDSLVLDGWAQRGEACE